MIRINTRESEQDQSTEAIMYPKSAPTSKTN